MSVNKSIFKQSNIRIGTAYPQAPSLFQSSSMSYIFFIIRYCHFQSPFIMAYRYTRLAKSLSFTGVANYQGMSRHMDMRTLRIQSAEALPEAP